MPTAYAGAGAQWTRCPGPSLGTDVIPVLLAIAAAPLILSGSRLPARDRVWEARAGSDDGLMFGRGNRRERREQRPRQLIASSLRLDGPALAELLASALKQVFLKP